MAKKSDSLIRRAKGKDRITKGQLTGISEFRKRQILVDAGLTPAQARQIVPDRKSGLQVAGDIAKELALFVPEAVVRTGLTAAQLPLTALETSQAKRSAGEAAAFQRKGPTQLSLNLPGLRRQESPFSEVIRQTGEASTTGEILKGTAAATGQTAFDIAFGLLPTTRAVNTLTGGRLLTPISARPPPAGSDVTKKAINILTRPIPTFQERGLFPAIRRAATGGTVKQPTAAGAAKAAEAGAGVAAGVSAKPGRRFRDIFKRAGVADDVADDLVKVTTGRRYGDVKGQLSKRAQAAFKKAGVSDDVVVSAQQAAVVLTSVQPKSAGAAVGTAKQTVKLLDDLASPIDDIITRLNAGAKTILKTQADELADPAFIQKVQDDVLSVLARSRGALKNLTPQERIEEIASALSSGVQSDLKRLGDLASRQTTGIAAKQARETAAQLEAFLRQPGVKQGLTRAIFEPNPGTRFIPSGQDLAGLFARAGQSQTGALPRSLQQPTSDALRAAGLTSLARETGNASATQRGLVQKLKAAGVFGDDAAFRKKIDSITGEPGIPISNLNAGEVTRLLREAKLSRPQSVKKLRDEANEIMLFATEEEMFGKVKTAAGPGQVDMGTAVMGTTLQAIFPWQLVVGKLGKAGKTIVRGSRAGIVSRDRMHAQATTAIIKATGGKKLSPVQMRNYFDVVWGKGKAADSEVRALVKELNAFYRQAGKRAEKAEIPVFNPKNGTWSPFTMRQDFGAPKYLDRVKLQGMTREEVVGRIMANDPSLKRPDAIFISNLLRKRYSSNAAGSVTFSRIYKDLPNEFFLQDPYEVALRYSKQVGQTLGMADEFGLTISAGGKDLVHEGFDKAAKLIGEEFGAQTEQYVRTGFQRIIGKDLQSTHFGDILAGTFPGKGPIPRFIRGVGGVRGWQAMSKLGVTTTITNLGGNNNTIMAASLKAFVKGAKQGATAQGKAHAKAQLGLLDDVANYFADAGGSAAIGPKRLLEWLGFSPVERGNRISGFFASQHHMIDDVIPQLKAGNPRGRSWLRDFIFMGDDEAADVFIKGLKKKSYNMTQNDLNDIGRGFVTSTQFKPDVLSLPLWTTSNWGRVLFQFKTFMFRHTALLSKIYRSAALDSVALAKQGRFVEAASAVSPVVRHLGGSVMIGELIGDLRALATGSPRNPDIPMLDDEKFALLSRLIDNMLWVGGVGIAHDMFTAAQNRKFAEWALGPTASDAIEMVQTAAQTAESGNFEPGFRKALRAIPAIGAIAQPRLIPTQRQEKAQREQGEDISGLLGL